MILSEKDRKHVKWYDYLWLLIPIAGIAGFVATIEARSRQYYR